jgi:Glycosyltransferase 61
VETVTLSEYFEGRDGLQILRPPCRYERMPPVLVNPDATTRSIRRRYRRMLAETPSEGVAVFPDATIFGSGVIRTEDGRILAESQERPGKSPLGGTDPDAPPARTFEAAVHVGKRGNSNYGHFLVEMLPRLALNAGAYPEDAPILLHRLSKPFALPMLAQVGIDERRVAWIDNRPVRVRELYWPTRNTYHPLNNSPHVFSFLRELAPPANGGRRLFVGRRDAANRQLLNEDEVLTTLDGFEQISPGHVPFGEQIETFARAEMVVAVVGAALTNLVFMPPGGTVVMLQPATAAGYFFWDLAHHCDQKLVILWGENDDPTVGDKNADFRVDTRMLAACAGAPRR